MKRLLFLTLSFILLVSVFAQNTDDEIFEVNTHTKKSAKMAMAMSSIFPGAGQFYANPKTITAYIFPVIEIGLWAGLLHFNSKGKDMESNYEKFANGEEIDAYHYTNEDNQVVTKKVYRYDRERQAQVQANLIFKANNMFYDNHFRLDGVDMQVERNNDGSILSIDYSITIDNTQHFYEDIGKYNKYLFGWYDWYNIYAMDELGADVLPGAILPPPDNQTHWIWDSNKWIGNEPRNTSSPYYTANPNTYEAKNGIYSDMRDEYIQMRSEAEDYYQKSDIMMFGLLTNHILAAIDAVRVTKKTNLSYLSKNEIKIKLSPVFVHNQLAAGFTVEKRF
jgi:hypothetical protein